MIYGWIALIALAIFAGAEFHGHSRGVDDERAKQASEERIAQVAGAAAAASAAEAISRIEVRHVHNRQVLEREVQTNTVYRDCRADPLVLRKLNAAITGSDEAAPAGELPASGGAR